MVKKGNFKYFYLRRDFYIRCEFLITQSSILLFCSCSLIILIKIKLWRSFGKSEALFKRLKFIFIKIISLLVICVTSCGGCLGNKMGQRTLSVVGHRLVTFHVLLILRICYCYWDLCVRKQRVGWDTRCVMQQKHRVNTIHSVFDSFTVAVAVAVIRGF